MLFNSYMFILAFFPAVFIIYFMLNHFHRNRYARVFLLLASHVFYGWVNWKYLPILWGSILINFVIYRIQIGKGRAHPGKGVMALAVILNVGLLFYFKYMNFFVQNLNQVLQTDYTFKTLILPIGLSFYTFQQIAFQVSVYQGKTNTYSLLDYSLFVSFFTYISSGPIVFHDEVLPQFHDESKWKINPENVAQGITLFATGLFKKVIVADTFARAVGWGFGDIQAMTSLDAFLVVLSYTIQIFFDFSGYSDMSIGISRMLNITLPVNFRSPYQSTSIIDFWDRWHITLTRFLRQYIYFPLGGSRKGKIRTYINIMAVFLISGLWHGASWNFILWGGVHGAANILNRILKKEWERFNVVFRWGCNFLFIMFTWVIFRSGSISEAGAVIKKIVSCESLSISPAFLANFKLTELTAVFQYTPVIRYFYQRVNGLFAWLFIGCSLIAVLNCPGLEDRRFKLSKTQAVLTVFMLVWPIMSFSGISIFLYSNF